MAAFYSLADCARLLRRPRETVREWTTKGLAPARSSRPRFSPGYGFSDLISLYVVGELRDRGVPLQRIRAAEKWLRHEGGLARPFATRRLYTAGKDVLVRLEALAPDPVLVAANRAGQAAIEEAFGEVLQSVDYDAADAAIRWRPGTGVEVSVHRQFGAPCLSGTGIQTSMIYRLVRAGDEPEDLARSYSVPVEAITSAVAWEASLVEVAA